MADPPDRRKGQPPADGPAPGERLESASDAGDTGSEPGGRGPATLEEARAHIADLEADLAAARSTIEALLDKVERVAGQPGARAEGDGPGEREDAGNAPPSESSGANGLDTLIRQRTRALAESEEQLRRKNIELERINEMKVEFISIATHELRTPLTSIVGYLDLLAEGSFGELPKTMERPLASLHRNAHRLKRLVDEMLDVSRIDSGRVTLYRTRCDLGVIVRDVVAELRPEAAAKRLEIDASIAAPPEIYADANKIRQAACKLIANAIRNTPEGGAITARVDTAPPEQFAGVWARLRVRGTGISIPNHMRNRIFEPFSAMHTAKHHTSSGPDSAGLGLYIARGLIDLHGGLISVDSKEDAYTEFTVLLPCGGTEQTL